MKILVLIVFIFNSFLFGLTNEMLADKYLIAAKKFVKAKEYKKAVDNFEKIFDLGIAVPNDMYYFYAKSLKNSGDIIKAYDVFNLYIEKTGRGSSHYQEALGFMIDMEDDVIAKKKMIIDNRIKHERETKRREQELLKKKKEDLIRNRISDSHENWIFIEENDMTYYGMVSYSKTDAYVATLKIGVFNNKIKYIFSIKFPSDDYLSSIVMKNWKYTRVQYPNPKTIYTVLKSGKNCANNKCIFNKSKYESIIDIEIDELEDLALFKKSKYIKFKYDKASYYTHQSKEYVETENSSFTMPGGKKLKDIIDIIIERIK